ncbi:hypothetical protein EH63_25775 [Escherichia coli]|nr:hypothetical protein EH63_25775 [Escherichia coli]
MADLDTDFPSQSMPKVAFPSGGGHGLMYRHMTEPFQELLFHKHIRLEPDNTGMKHAQIMRFKIVAYFFW